MGDTSKRWTLENIEKELGKPVGFFSKDEYSGFIGILPIFGEGAARLSMNFDQKMRFHFSYHLDSPFVALGLDILYILVVTPIVVQNLIPTIITIVLYFELESDTAILARQ